MGRNGAGKSTTFKALMALIPQRGGTVRFLGEDISNLKPFEIARRGLGFVPEDRRIFSDLTVAENLDIGRQPIRYHPDGRPAPSWTPEKLFTIFPNLAGMPDRRGAHMSGGEQQMLTVARTLMGNPLLVLLDEPSEGVAPVIVEQMANTIIELKKEHPFRGARLRPRLCSREGAIAMAWSHGRARQGRRGPTPAAVGMT